MSKKCPPSVKECALFDENSRLKAEVKDWMRGYERERETISRVWKALGITTFQDAIGKTIYELVAEASRRAAAGEKALAVCRKMVEYAEPGKCNALLASPMMSALADEARAAVVEDQQSVMAEAVKGA